MQWVRRPEGSFQYARERRVLPHRPSLILDFSQRFRYGAQQFTLGKLLKREGDDAKVAAAPALVHAPRRAAGRDSRRDSPDHGAAWHDPEHFLNRDHTGD